MARISHGIVSTLPFLLFLVAVPTSLCAPKKVASPARKDDVPFIKCQVCDKLARQIHHQVRKKAAEISPKKVSEFQIIEITEKVCNLKKQEADWILMIDIAEKGDTLELMEYLDTDIAEYIYTKKPSVDVLVKHLCHDLSEACSTEPPPVPKNRIPGEPFIPKSSKEAEMDRILKSMEGMPGAPDLEMYSREDLLNMNNMDGEDDEGDDDDDGFLSKSGKLLREKDSSKADLKQRILRQIKETGTALKRHAKKASGLLKKWWRGSNEKKLVKPAKSEL